MIRAAKLVGGKQDLFEAECVSASGWGEVAPCQATGRRKTIAASTQPEAGSDRATVDG